MWMEKPLADAWNAARILCMIPAPDGSLRLRPELEEESLFADFLRLLHAQPGEAMLPDYANALGCRRNAPPLAEALERGLFLALCAAGVDFDAKNSMQCEERDFRLRHAETLLDAPRRVLEALSQNPNLSPAAKHCLAEAAAPCAEEVAARLRRRDPFGGGRAYRYYAGTFTLTTLDTVRPLERFFGYSGLRQRFAEHFRDFSSGSQHIPLLISSLPGHGKTQLTLSHALAIPNLTLILAPPETLSGGLDSLFALLALRPDRKFVVFFDDIEPDKTDWYGFRTHVGGVFSPPEHVLVVVASNYFFPPSILSRGRSFVFPVFDEIRCQEMVEDFLILNGMRHPSRPLIAMIAADYCEAFGQKQFSELSPRTLIRHLASYERSQEKRRQMLELSAAPLTTRPDSQLFQDFNLSQMRLLYGQEHLDELLKEKLRALENGL